MGFEALYSIIENHFYTVKGGHVDKVRENPNHTVQLNSKFSRCKFLQFVSL